MQGEETIPQTQFKETTDNANVGNKVTLPYDVWELIGNYILPESIRTFSRICKDSYAVTNQPPFWVRLHRDFHPFELNTPITHIKGLKKNVIRHLFINYLPFASRLNSSHAKIYDPHTLIDLICLKHELIILQCEEGSATRRIRLDITLGKLEPSQSLWEAGQVSPNYTSYS